MADTFTTRLGLLKPDPLDTYDVGVYSGSMDKIDASIGQVPCTSSTRPGTPYNGMRIIETDTLNEYVYMTAGSAGWYLSRGAFTTANLPTSKVLQGAFAIATDTNAEYVYRTDLTPAGGWLTGGMFASTALPSSKILTGTNIVVNDLGQMRWWNGTSWINNNALGVARYEKQSGLVTMVNSDQIVAFPTAVQTSSFVTKTGNSYTLAAGTWLIDCAIRVDMTQPSVPANTDFALYFITGSTAGETTAFDGAWGKDPLSTLTTSITFATATTVSVDLWRGGAGGSIASFGAGLTHVQFTKLA